ncbi:MAG: hypothetical protein ACSHYB_08805 [Roseibacillus sp.]
MKTFKYSVCSLLLLLGNTLASEDAPTGYLDASSLLVRATSKVNLDWKVEFPGGDEIEEICEIDPETDTVTTTTETSVKIRLLGAGYGNDYAYGWQESWVKFSDEWVAGKFFEGTGDTVNPNEILKNRTVGEGIELNMGFRGCVYATASTPWWKRTWNDWRMMGVGHGGILILKNGDLAPQFSPESSNQLSAKTFLTPYLSADGENIKIGPRDLIILVDLNKSSAAEGADYQDQVILMTFNDEEVEVEEEDNSGDSQGRRSGRGRG